MRVRPLLHYIRGGLYDNKFLESEPPIYCRGKDESYALLYITVEEALRVSLCEYLILLSTQEGKMRINPSSILQ